MTYIVNESCVKCKYTDCVEVCPVDCFHEGNNLLVINPEVCIDCGVCVEECPAQAILSDTDLKSLGWIDFNNKYSKIWPVLRKRNLLNIDSDYWLNKSKKITFL